MRTLLLISLMTLFVSAPTAFGGQWLADYGAALRQAQTEGRPLLVVLHKPSSVQPVKFAVENAEEEDLLEPYKLCKIDVTTPYGQRVAAAFKVTEVPLTVIIDRTASVQIYRKTGAIQPDEWKATLLKYREGRRPVQQVFSQMRSNRAFCST